MSDTSQPVTHPGTRAEALIRPLGPPLLIALGYYVGAKLGFALTLSPVPVSTLWPPNSILLAGLVLTPPATWPRVLAAVFGAHLAVQFQSGVPMGMVLCWFVSNCMEALIGAVLLRRFGGGRESFEAFRGAVIFLACAGLAAPFVSTFVDAGFVVLNGWGDAAYWTIWRSRFFSNVLAEITLVPVVLTTAHSLRRFRQTPRRRALEAVAAVVALAAICWLVFVQRQPGPGTSPALLYTPLPLLVGAAVWWGPWGASVSFLVCALVAIWGAVLGQGPFVNSSPQHNALSIQLFLIVAWVPVMSLAAVIRERARADAKARASQEQLALAIEAAEVGRWEWDIVAGQLTWSDITRRMYEVPADAPVTPETFEALIHPDDRPLIAAATAEGIAGRDVDVEFRIVFPDGRMKWILSKGRTVYDADGRPTRMIGVKVDITDRKSAELRIQEQRRLLGQLSPVSVAGEMSMALAHEVNQPLAAILANASAARRFLLKTPPDLRELGEILEAIAHDNRRAADVVRRFGALLKKGEAERRLLEINAVVASVLDLTRNDVISRGVSLQKHFGAGLPSVYGDIVQLQQVLLNLVINACDAMESVPPGARCLKVVTGPGATGGVLVTVSDTGAGIPADILDQVFEPFVSTKPKRLGLGLAICRSIVSAHEGDLRVEQTTDRGATFSLSLPAATDAQSRARHGTLPTQLAAPN